MKANKALNLSKSLVAIQILMAAFLLGCSQGSFVANSLNSPVKDVTPSSTEQPVENPETSQPTVPSTPTPPSPAKASKPTNGRGGAKGNIQESCPGRNVALHVPSNYSDSRPTAIVVAMHGLGDTYQNFNSGGAYAGWHNLADEKNFIYMVPSSRNQNRQSFLYFNADNSPNTSAIVDEAESLLECIYRNIGSKYNIETNEIYWIGFSEGASFTAFVSNYLSQRLKAVAIYGGSAPRNPSIIKRNLPIYFLTGTSDYGYDAIRSQSTQWTSHPNVRNFVQASHSFSQLNARVSPREVFEFLSKTEASPVESGF